MNMLSQNVSKRDAKKSRQLYKQRGISPLNTHTHVVDNIFLAMKIASSPIAKITSNSTSVAVTTLNLLTRKPLNIKRKRSGCCEGRDAILPLILPRVVDVR